MAFNATNPVVVGDSTKKLHYDRAFDNTLLLKTSISDDGLTWGSTVLATGTVGYHLGASGTSYGFVGTNTAHDFYLRRSGSNIWQITSANVMLYVGTPTNYQSPALQLANDIHWLRLGSDALSVVQGAGSNACLMRNMQYDGSGWRNISNAAVSQIMASPGEIYFSVDSTPGAAYTAFTPTVRLKIDVNQLTASVGVHPGADNTHPLGNASFRWSECRAVNFYGALTGNATTATSATTATTADTGKTSGGFSGSGSYTTFTFSAGFCTSAS